MRQHDSRNGTPQIAALSRSLAMLEAVLDNDQGQSVNAIAANLGLPRATAHRQVTTLIAEKYLLRLPSGQLCPGPRLLALLHKVDESQQIAFNAAPLLHRLAEKLKCVVQLGTLENDMVTYRIKTGTGAGNLFTRVGMQLEAYCTAIGKVLLAFLPDAQRSAFLATGPFPAITPRTITDPVLLADELAKVRDQSYARDNEEIAEGLICLAVPIRNAGGRVVAAISASRPSTIAVQQGDDFVLAQLFVIARTIGDATSPHIPLRSR